MECLFKSETNLSLRIWVAVLLLFLVVGCHESDQNGGDTQRPANVDAGIIFEDSSNYLCWPLSKLGILESPEEISSVTTSCDCIHGTIVAYHFSDDEIAYAVLLEFSPEKDVARPQPVSNLRVIMRVELKSGSNREFTVSLLSTHRLFASEDAPISPPEKTVYPTSHPRE